MTWISRGRSTDKHRGNSPPISIAEVAVSLNRPQIGHTTVRLNEYREEPTGFCRNARPASRGIPRRDKRVREAVQIEAISANGRQRLIVWRCERFRLATPLFVPVTKA
jgi:hypothetical protein